MDSKPSSNLSATAKTLSHTSETTWGKSKTLYSSVIGFVLIYFKDSSR
jgi:hypothetical protein